MLFQTGTYYRQLMVISTYQLQAVRAKRDRILVKKMICTTDHFNSVLFGLKQATSEKSCVFSRLLVTAPFAFCAITFEPIEVHSCSELQNDSQNLSFVKYIYVDSGKLARNGRKTAIYHFVSIQVQKNILAFCVITFEPIEVQTLSAPQNDRLNCCFDKNGKKLARNCQKRPFWPAGGGGYQ